MREIYFFSDRNNGLCFRIRLQNPSTFSPGKRDFCRGYFFRQWVHISSDSKAAAARLRALRPENSSETENGQLNECQAFDVERKHRQVRRLNATDPFHPYHYSGLKAPATRPCSSVVRSQQWDLQVRYDLQNDRD